MTAINGFIENVRISASEAGLLLALSGREIESLDPDNTDPTIHLDEPGCLARSRWSLQEYARPSVRRRTRVNRDASKYKAIGGDPTPHLPPEPLPFNADSISVVPQSMFRQPG
jgi:hypothetical protein